MIFSNLAVETESAIKMKNLKKPDLGIAANVISGGVVSITISIVGGVFINRYVQ